MVEDGSDSGNDVGIDRRGIVLDELRQAVASVAEQEFGGGVQHVVPKRKIQKRRHEVRVGGGGSDETWRQVGLVQDAEDAVRGRHHFV